VCVFQMNRRSREGEQRIIGERNDCRGGTSSTFASVFLFRCLSIPPHWYAYRNENSTSTKECCVSVTAESCAFR
jgi:hypothetical protein